MSTFINILSDSTFAEKMDTQNALLRILARKEYLELHTWTDVQALVRTGLAKEVLSIGDQLICQKEGKSLVWDVVGFDSESLSNADGSPHNHKYAATPASTAVLTIPSRPPRTAPGISVKQSAYRKAAGRLSGVLSSKLRRSLRFVSCINSSCVLA